MKIAVCIPTFKRNFAVKDFLKNCAPYYIKLGLDIYYFDSSPDKETEEILEKYHDNEHINYIRMPVEYSLDEVTLMIYSGYGLKDEYDFLWLCGDTVQFPEAGINQILESISPQEDMVTIEFRNYIRESFKSVFTNQNDYFRKSSIAATQYGSVLLNCKSMLKDVDWNRYKSICINPDFNLFAYISFYYRRILELPSFCGSKLDLGQNRRMISKGKKASMWYDKLFSVWCGGWVKVIQSLPENYTDKEAVIMELGEHFFPEKSTFIQLRAEGNYSIKTFMKYLNNWRFVTHVSLTCLCLVSVAPRFVLDIFFHCRNTVLMEKMRGFLRKHDYIYICGCGTVGQAHGLFFDKYDFSYEGYLDIFERCSEQHIFGHEVFKLSEINTSTGKTGLILALGPKDMQNALPLLEGINKKHLFICPELRKDILAEMGYKKAWI